jgi:hypothetical protein
VQVQSVTDTPRKRPSSLPLFRKGSPLCAFAFTHAHADIPFDRSHVTHMHTYISIYECVSSTPGFMFLSTDTETVQLSAIFAM